eukprot:SAG11_NODE_4406_length_1909_cov_2.299448_2_plen_103_part_00
MLAQAAAAPLPNPAAAPIAAPEVVLRAPAAAPRSSMVLEGADLQARMGGGDEEAWVSAGQRGEAAAAPSAAADDEEDDGWLGGWPTIKDFEDGAIPACHCKL